MIFTSLFFPILVFVAFCMYYATKRKDFQNVILLAASLIFYGYLNISFLLLLVAIVLISHVAGLLIEKYESHKRLIASGSITILLVNLCSFKYMEIIVELAHHALGIDFTGKMGTEFILPAGISFYTFQAISYIVDTSRKMVKTNNSILTYGVYIVFFPQLIAGPIERASHIIPQLEKERPLKLFNIATGLQIIIIGYFVKIFIADRAGLTVDGAFHYHISSGWTTVLNVILFSIQIYSDFWGYSLIAKGIAKLFGIDLVWNFKSPYRAMSVTEFWRRWHISLSEWLRDYIYIPLGGSRGPLIKTCRNLIITFAVCGAWHGAGVNFVIWGIYHGVLLCISRIVPKYISIPSIPITNFFRWLFTLAFVQFGWLLFRVRSMEKLNELMQTFSRFIWLEGHFVLLKLIFLTVLAMICAEILQNKIGNIRENKKISLARGCALGVMVFLTWVSFDKEYGQQFIYFSF